MRVQEIEMPEIPDRSDRDDPDGQLQRGQCLLQISTPAELFSQRIEDQCQTAEESVGKGIEPGVVRGAHESETERKDESGNETCPPVDPPERRGARDAGMDHVAHDDEADRRSDPAQYFEQYVQSERKRDI